MCAKRLQIAVFFWQCFSRPFRIFTRVAARLLHRDSPTYLNGEMAQIIKPADLALSVRTPLWEFVGFHS